MLLFDVKSLSHFSSRNQQFGERELESSRSPSWVPRLSTAGDGSAPLLPRIKYPCLFILQFESALESASITKAKMCTALMMF